MITKRIISFAVILTLFCTFIPTQVSFLPTVEASFHTIDMEGNKEIYFSQVTRTGVFMWQTGSENDETKKDDTHNHTEHLYYRVQEISGEWSSWYPVLEDHDGEHDEVLGKHYSQMLFFPETRRLQLQIEKEDVHLEDVTFIAFQENRTVRFTTFETPEVKAQNAVPIVSRTQWGADPAWIEKETWEVERAKVCVAKPSYCVSSPEAEKAVAEKAKKLQEDYPEDTKISERITALEGKELYWAISKSDKVRKLFVHHTAELTKDINGDGVLNQEDEKMVMRNTYYFHSLVRGWGDIGYNFIVGPTGTIYEGRVGGDKVVAAHAVWRNISSIGVSTMGNFEEEEVATAQMTGLANILGYLSKKYALDPEGSTLFYGKTDHTILGHRDSPAAATACPGANLYTKLPQLRTLAKKAMSVEITTSTESPANTSSNGYGISFMPLESVISFQATEEKTFAVQVKNTGTKEWPKGAVLRMNTNTDFFDILSGDKTAQSTYVIANSVPVGKTSTMNISLRSLYRSLNDTISFSLVLPNGIVSNTFLMPVSIEAGNSMYEHSKTIQPKQELLFNEETKFLFHLKNTGTTTWYTHHFSGIVENKGAISLQSGTVVLREAIVRPGEIGTVEVPLKAPIQAGTYALRVSITLQGKVIPGTILELKGTTTHPYNAQLFSLQPQTSFAKTVTQGSTATASIYLKNTSAYPWTGLSKMDLTMASLTEIPLRAASTARFSKDYIQPGEVVELLLPLQVGYAEVSEPMVQLMYLGLPITKSAFSLPVVAGKEITSGEVATVVWKQGILTIAIRNTGNSTWAKERVFLDVKNVSSSLSAQWENSLGHVTHQESSVAPGAYAHFVLSSKDFPNIDQATLSLDMDMGANIPVTGKIVVKNETIGVPPLEFGTTLRRFLVKFPLFAR